MTIWDIRNKEVRVYELALFAGAGGGLLGSRLLGWHTRCAVEIDPYCRSILLARQRDGQLGRFPIWDDIRTFEGRPWVGSIDVITGGFPCQDISSAGNGRGLAGSRSGLWIEMLRIIEEIRPTFVFAENSPNLRTRGLGTILQGLDRVGYDARWCVLGAGHVGANHERKRMWVLAYSNNSGERTQPIDAKMAGPLPVGDLVEKTTDTKGQRGKRGFHPSSRKQQTYTVSRIPVQHGQGTRNNWWTIPHFAGVDDGMAHRMDRIKATGNGQVPAVAKLAWDILSQGLL